MKSTLTFALATMLCGLLAPLADAAKPTSLPPTASPTAVLHSAITRDSASSPSASLDLPVAQDIPDVGTLEGTLTISGFIVDGGVIKAEATLDATITDDTGAEVGAVDDLPALLPLTSTAGTTSDALQLELGPVDLDLDGTDVTLNKVTLAFDEDSSPSHAFGRLLALAERTLNSDRSRLSQIRNVLNLILRLSEDEDSE